jgi:hypothetical protein
MTKESILEEIRLTISRINYVLNFDANSFDLKNLSETLLNLMRAYKELEEEK